jgi:hypothetical protein
VKPPKVLGRGRLRGEIVLSNARWCHRLLLLLLAV